MANPLLEIIKQASVEAVQAGNPVKVVFGTVISESPLQIMIDQKIILTEEFLILCRNVTDYNLDMTVDHITEDADPNQTDKMSGGAYYPSFSAHLHKHSHKHPYKGRKTFLVHRKLLVGEEVLLLAMQGGQKFVVVDKIGSNIQ